MQSDELAILLFWLTLTFGMAVEAVKAETLTRRIGFGGTATLFLLIGLFWQQLQSRWPRFTTSVDSIVQSPETWFILCVLGYLMVSYWSPKRRPEVALRKLVQRLEDKVDNALTSYFLKRNDVEEDAPKTFTDKVAELDRKIGRVERQQRLSSAEIPPAEFQQLGESVAKLLQANEAIVGEQGRQNSHLSLVSKESDTFLTILQSSLSIAVLHSLPDGPQLPDITNVTRDTMGESQQRADKYFRDTMSTIERTRWAPELDWRMLQQNAEMAADARLREVRDLPDGLSVIDLRHYVIAKVKAEQLSNHLFHKKQEHTVKELRGLLTRVVKTIEARDEFNRTGVFQP